MVLNGLFNDFGYAARQLRKSPAFTLTVLITLGLCLGANTAVYTVIDRLFFRALPYPEPDRLVMLVRVFAKNGASKIETDQTGQVWELARDHASFLDSAVAGGSSGVNLFAAGHVEFVQQQRVSANFFRVLGVAPLLGREFTRQEDVPGGPALVVLSYGLWKRDFQGDPGIVGRSVDLRGAPYTVTGVMPEGFRTNQPTDVWTPLRPTTTGEGSGTNYEVIARLKPGLTFAQANGQLSTIMLSPLARRGTDDDETVEHRAVPLQTGITADIRSRMNLMWGAVGLVLLIGCVNIACILLARSATRSREVATRMAIGATRARIVVQLLAEALLLAFGGGLLGMLIGQFALDTLVRLDPEQFAMWGPVQLDFRVMAILLAAALATSILFGLFPAWEATAVELRAGLNEAGRGSAGGRRQWKRQILVFAEVALAVMLVVAAGLLIRTFSQLVNAKPGFNPEHVLTASLSLQDARYSTSAAGDRLFRASLERIRQIPGVEAAGVALSVPYERALNVGIQGISGQDLKGRFAMTNFAYATPGMFEALQMPLLRGRVFTDADNATAGRVAVVNQAFAARYLDHHGEALGTFLRFGDVKYRVVGVVSTVQQKNAWGDEWGPIDTFPQAYVPAAQMPDGSFAGFHIWFSPSWIVRTHGDIGRLPGQMKEALLAVDPRLPFSSFHTFKEIRGKVLNQQSYFATLFQALAGLALLLAALGVYGLVAQSVAQRTREMGIRLALGASTRAVIRSAAMPGVVLALGGTATGIVLALFATRVLKSLLWGVAPTDPTTFASVGLLLVVVAGAASLIPALRLTRLDLAQTLRNE
jgi:predicted permease